MKNAPVDRAAVAAIRGRYRMALEAGMKHEDAVAHANGKKGARAQAARPPVAAPVPAPESTAEIPADLSGLTWQQLRSLGIEHVGAEARSMKRPEIEAALAAKRDGT